MNFMPRVNVGIICGDSRDRLTEQCLDSLYAHTDHSLMDVTVLANAVSDETWRLLIKLAKKYGFGLTYYDKALGGGAVTNRLLETARENQGEFLYHTASDFYFKPGWLESLLTNWPICESMGIGLLGAYSHPYHRTNSITQGIGADIHFKDMVAGGSWFMPWTIWDRFGPLNELHHGNWIGSEDSEFNFRLINAGVGRATLVPEGVIHTGRTASNSQPTMGAEWMKDEPGVIIE